MVLKIYLEKALQQMGVEAIVDQADVTVAKYMGADIILTSETFANLVSDEGGGARRVQVVTIRNFADVPEYVAKLKEAMARVDAARGKTV